MKNMNKEEKLMDKKISASYEHAQKLSDDDFAARITSIFLPFIDRDIPDGKFILLQEKLKGILREHGKNLQKEEKS